ncbi:hypothetical protein AYK26_03460 [Euryarchaeota archaeon SM23-78]|nr:MAG: hypothetical protein AYK26_03460 [Euryarchaeota archaeon SM23-78]MBW3001081.1 hypothetical protein [Candidatus Woesearchaeota archaeon]
MPHYILKPKEDTLEKVKKYRLNLDMIVEGNTILGILTDTDRFPKTKGSIEEYIIRVAEQTIEFRLKTELDKNICDYLSKYWDIKEK